MKALLVTAGLLFAACSPAMSQTTATGTATAGSSSQSGAIAIGGSGTSTARAGGGNAQVIFNTPGQTRANNTLRQSGSLRTTPSVGGVGLGAASVESCYGPGVGGGFAVTGFGGNFAMGQFDRDCNARLYSRTLFAMGYKAAAIQLLVNESPVVASAFGLGQGGQQLAPVAYAPRTGARLAPTRVAVSGCSRHIGGNPTLPCVE
jgi:hypothetical protein